MNGKDRMYWTVKRERDFSELGLGIAKVYHPEYGAHVYQPIVQGGQFVEPYTDIRQAIAFLEGVRLVSN